MSDKTLMAAVIDREVERLSGFQELADELRKAGGIEAHLAEIEAKVAEGQKQLDGLATSIKERQLEDQNLAATVQSTLDVAEKDAAGIRQKADFYATGKRDEADALLADATTKARKIEADAEAEAREAIKRAQDAVAKLNALSTKV